MTPLTPKLLWQDGYLTTTHEGSMLIEFLPIEGTKAERKLLIEKKKMFQLFPHMIGDFLFAL